MPRLLLRVSLIVWRVPNETSPESVARICAAEISAIAAASAGSRLSPIVTSGGGATTGRCADSVAATKLRVVARRTGKIREVGMLSYLDANGFDRSEYRLAVGSIQ